MHSNEFLELSRDADGWGDVVIGFAERLETASDVIVITHNPDNGLYTISEGTKMTYRDGTFKAWSWKIENASVDGQSMMLEFGKRTLARARGARV